MTHRARAGPRARHRGRLLGARIIDLDPTDRWQLYEGTVQVPEVCVAHLRSLHTGEPLVLGEDFSGSAALSRAWVRAIPGARAIAVDHDASALERARRAAEPGVLERIELLAGDVRAASDPRRHAADVVFAGNFSVGELATRAGLLAYLRHARSRLRPGGIFVCDTYAGAGAWRTGAVERSRWLGDGTRLRWTWEQRSADPATARVLDALHFRVERAGVVEGELCDAFVYRWRLWSPPELCDALLEAGFERAEVETAIGGEAAPGIEGDALFVACVVGRASE